MQFLEALPDIIAENNINFHNIEGCDLKIVDSFKRKIDLNDIEQFIQYEDLRLIVQAFGINIFSRTLKALVTDKQHHYSNYPYLLFEVEKITDETDKIGVSCVISAYFIYAAIHFCELVDPELARYGIKPVEWSTRDDRFLDPDKKTPNGELSFGKGRYLESLDDFEIQNGVLNKYVGRSITVVIPSCIKAIGRKAFENTNVCSVRMFDNVQSIGAEAFKGCDDLFTIILPSNVTKIEKDTFKGCVNLQYVNSNNIEELGEGAFEGCSRLKTKFSSLRRVDRNALSGCKSLNKFEFINNLDYIGENALSELTVTEITLKDGVQLEKNSLGNLHELDTITFNKITGLKGNVTILEGSTNVSKIVFNQKLNCSLTDLFVSNFKEFEAKFPKPLIVETNHLVAHQFENCKTLTKVYVKEARIIPENCFAGCRQLDTVVFDKPITEINKYAFVCCKNLENIQINFEGKSIGEAAFACCSNIHDFSFLNGVTRFSKESLSYCDLSNFNFDRKFDFIAEEAFSESIFPKYISKIRLGGFKVGKLAFQGATNIDILEVTNFEDIQGGKIYSLFAETNDQFNKKVSILKYQINCDIVAHAFENNENIETIEFNCTNGIVPEFAFKNCSHLRRVTINGKVKEIKDCAFKNCPALEEIVMDYNSLKIDEESFRNDVSFGNSIDFKKITHFGKLSFNNTNLLEVELSNDTDYIGFSAFGNNKFLSKVTIPFAGTSSDDQYSKYFGLAFASQCEEDDKSYSAQNIILEDKLYSFFIPSGLKEVTLNSKIVSEDAFKNCSNIQIVNFPFIEELDCSIFSGCSELKEINLGASLKKFSGEVLYGLNLESIHIDQNCSNFVCRDKSIYSKDGQILYYLSKGKHLNDVINNIKEISSYAVTETDETLTIDGDLKVAKNAINAKNIKNISFNLATNVEKGAFYNVDGLKTLTIKDSELENIFSATKPNIEFESIKVVNSDLNNLGNLFLSETEIKTLKIVLDKCSVTGSFFKKFKDVKEISITNVVGELGEETLADTNISSLYIDKLNGSFFGLFGNKPFKIDYLKADDVDLVSETFRDSAIGNLELGVVNKIEADAFNSAFIQNLKAKSISNINDKAFKHAHIKNFQIGVLNGCKFVDKCLYQDGKLLRCFNETLETFNVPDDVNEIMNFAFEDARSLLNFNCNHEDLILNTYAFKGCYSLENLILNNFECEKLNTYFSYCNLKTIKVHKKIITKKYFTDLNTVEKIQLIGTTKVDDSAFANCIKLEEIKGLENVNEFGDLVFAHCDSLTRMTISNNCQRIGLNAFKDCESLKYLSMPIDKFQQENGIKLKDIISINNSEMTVKITNNVLNEGYFEDFAGFMSFTKPLVTIPKRAFKNAKKLSSLDLSRVEFIGEEAFASTDLKTANLPQVYTIEDNAFKNSSLEELIFGNKLVNLSATSLAGCPIKNIDGESDKYIVVDSLLIDKETRTIVKYVSTNKVVKEITIYGEEIGTISEFAFVGSKFVSITVKGNVRIKLGAFARCSNLKNITFEGDVFIEDYIFDEVNLLDTITIPELNFNGQISIGNLFKDKYLPSTLKTVNITRKISEQDFDIDNTISSINIPNDTLEIPAKYYEKCHAISKIILPEGLKVIRKEAFKNCSEIKELIIPNSVQLIDENILVNATGLESLKTPFIGRTMEETASSNYMFGHTLTNIKRLEITKSTLYVVKAFNKENLAKVEEITLPSGIETIPIYCFQALTKLKEINTDFSKVIEIGDAAFDGCINLEPFSLENVEKIGVLAFNSTKLKEINLKNIRKIGKNAFTNCPQLTKVTARIVAKDEDSNTDLKYVFNNSKNIKNLVIENVKLDNDSFNGFDDIEEISFIQGCRNIPAFAFKDKQKLTKFSCNGVVIKSIGEFAFQNCISLNDISLLHCEKIGQRAFQNCSSLKEIIVGNTLQFIGDNAFKGCINVEKIGMNILGENFLNRIGIDPNDIVKFDYEGGEIYEGMFAEAKSLKYVVLANCEKLPARTFIGCEKLESIDLSKLKSIGKDCFSNSGLKGKINLVNCENIGEFAFANSKISVVTLNHSLRRIPKGAFKECIHLNEVNIPNNCVEIQSYAFEGTRLLKHLQLYFPKCLTKVGEFVFRNASSPVVNLYKENESKYNQNWDLNCIPYGMFNMKHRVRKHYIKK